jgi:hypothetical protein
LPDGKGIRDDGARPAGELGTASRVDDQKGSKKKVMRQMGIRVDTHGVPGVDSAMTIVRENDLIPFEGTTIELKISSYPRLSGDVPTHVRQTLHGRST